MTTSAAATPTPSLVRFYPLLFVGLWSTGFIGAKFGLPDAEPLTFLAIRYLIVLVLMLAIVWWTRAPWPDAPHAWLHIGVSGLLVHGVYLGGVFTAIGHGLPAGVAALVVGLQPVLTALGAGLLLHEQVPLRQWAGLALGFVGVGLVVGHKVVGGLPGGDWTAMLLPAIVALVGITAGTLYQKRFLAPCDVRTASLVQLCAAFAVTMPLALLESEGMNWNGQLAGAMAWSVLALTLGGSSLLYLLIQRGAATAVTSLLYLVPPCTAVMAWLLFDEALTITILAGMVLTAIGVSLVLRSPAAPRQ
jgi:drug/metabolite transporter (DMT)-like permease